MHYRWNTTLYIMAINLFMVHVNRLQFRLSEKIWRVLPLSHWLKKLRFRDCCILEIVVPFIFKVRSDMKSTKFDLASPSYRKRQCRLYEFVWTLDFVIRVDENPRKSMRTLAKELQADETTIRPPSYLWGLSLEIRSDGERTAFSERVSLVILGGCEQCRRPDAAKFPSSNIYMVM